jgi:hypothetical protein
MGMHLCSRVGIFGWGLGWGFWDLGLGLALGGITLKSILG